MFREFRELEAKVASIKDAKKTGRDDAFGASGGTEPGSPEDSPSAVPSGTGETWDVGLEAQVDVRAERDNKTRKIQEWAKEFEDREGHPPTSECVRRGRKIDSSLLRVYHALHSSVHAYRKGHRPALARVRGSRK